MRDDADYLNSTKALWLEQGNPIWLWLAIKSSSHNKHPYPQWVCEYLEKIADQLLSDDASIGDFARKLPCIFGFQAKRGPQHPLKIFKRMLGGATCPQSEKIEPQLSSVRKPVGYGRPPVESQFKPGASGNPNGRPKKSRNLKTIIRNAPKFRVLKSKTEQKS